MTFRSLFAISSTSWKRWSDGIGENGDLTIDLRRGVDVHDQFSCRVSGRIRSDMTAAVAALLEHELHCMWIPLCTGCSLLERISRQRSILRLEFDFVFVKKECIVEMYFRRLLSSPIHWDLIRRFTLFGRFQIRRRPSRWERDDPLYTSWKLSSRQHAPGRWRTPQWTGASASRDEANTLATGISRFVRLVVLNMSFPLPFLFLPFSSHFISRTKFPFLSILPISQKSHSASPSARLLPDREQQPTLIDGPCTARCLRPFSCPAAWREAPQEIQPSPLSAAVPFPDYSLRWSWKYSPT